MTIRLIEALEEHLPDIARIATSAFHPNTDALSRRLFPPHLQPRDLPDGEAAYDWRFARKASSLASPESHLVVAIDDEKGPDEKVVGFSLWDAPPASGGDSAPSQEIQCAALDKEAYNEMKKTVNQDAADTFGEQGIAGVWHLDYIGVSPGNQRRGIGKMLLQWGLDNAAAERKDCYLVATEAGRPLYVDAGFKDIRVVSILGVPHYSMILRAGDHCETVFRQSWTFTFIFSFLSFWIITFVTATVLFTHYKMASQRLFAAFAALSILIGSEASPCKPISSTTGIQATSTFSSETETATASDATFTTELTSTESSYATDITITESETATSSAAESTSTVVVSTTETSAFTSTTEAASTTSAAPVETPTIIINGDFESGSIAPWSNFGIGAYANIDSSTVHAGSCSLTMGSQASEWSNTFQVLRKSTLVANQPYSLSLYAKVSSGSSCTAFEAFIDNNDLNDSFGLRISVAGVQIASDFTPLSGEFSLTQTALDSSNPIRVVIRAKCGNGNVAWVDDVQLGISD
ncbi:hypothetical protein NOF04DRAFT_1405862 [Fusarium oxysporum II5]|nr:hypothetical protein NOF04DRAFT_1405862 [Fusarium oxysporum II5]